MRLEHRPYLAEAHLHCGAEGRGELGGMVGEVIRDGNAAGSAENLKATVNAGELAQILCNLLRRRAQIVGGGCGRERVVDIVPAGHHQVDLTELLALVHEVEFFIRALDIPQVSGIIVVRFAKAEGDHREGDVFDRVQHIFIIAVVDDQPRGQVTELVEALLDIVEGFEIVQMIGVDVGDDGDIGRQLEEGIHILARLTHDDVTLSHIAVAAQQRQLASDDRRGVEARTDQQLAEHGGGRGFAVGSGYGDGAVVAAGNDAQHYRALDRGDTLFGGCHQLGVILLDGGGIDDQLRALDVFRTVTHVHRNSVGADAVERFTLVRVGAGELKALAVQDLGQRAHARAADADEMDSFYMI